MASTPVRQREQPIARYGSLLLGWHPETTKAGPVAGDTPRAEIITSQPLVEPVIGIAIKKPRVRLVPPENRGAALRSNHGINRKLQHVDPIPHADRKRASRPALSRHRHDDRHSKSNPLKINSSIKGAKITVRTNMLARDPAIWIERISSTNSGTILTSGTNTTPTDPIE